MSSNFFLLFSKQTRFVVSLTSLDPILNAAQFFFSTGLHLVTAGAELSLDEYL